MIRSSAWRWGATMIFTAAALMAGCGDDDDDGDGGTATGGSVGETGGSSSGGGSSTGGAASGGTATGGAALGGAGGDAPLDIVDTAVAAGSFTKLAELLTAADLVDTLKGPGPFTVFAPTDAAFEAFEAANPGVLGSLTTAQVSNVLRYHVVSGEVLSTDLEAGEVETLSDGMATFEVELADGVTIVDDSELTETDATVTTADIEASNGVIHVIDEVLLPETP